MAALDAGPATGNAELFLGTPPTAAVEVHVPAGANSLSPNLAPFVDPSQAGTGITGAPVVPMNKTIVFGSTGISQVIVTPA